MSEFQPPTEDELREWEQLAEEATEGPWAWSDGFLWNAEADIGVLEHDSIHPEGCKWPVSLANAAFIAAARTGWPRTIAALRHLHTEIDRLADFILGFGGPHYEGSAVDNAIAYLRAKDREAVENRL